MRGLNIIAVSILMVGALYGCSKSNDEQGPPPAPVLTVAVPLAQRIVDQDEFTGRFEAPQTAEVRARVGGYIQQVHFNDGAYVRRGQLLFTLDARPAQAEVARARADLSQARAALNLARANLTRSEGLLESQAVSQAEVDTNRGAFEAAEAQVASTNAALNTANLNLSYTRVVAPLSGRVSDRRVDAGNLVAGGSSAGDILTTIVSATPIHFVFEGSEALLLKYQRQARSGGGAPVEIRLQDEATFEHSGRLDFTDNAIDAASGTVRLRAVVANADGFLKPGMFGQARVAGAAPYDALLVPDSAIATDQTRRVVQVVAADGSVTARPVQLGPLMDGLRVIRSGIAADDRVVISGAQRIMPGVKVQAEVGKIERQRSEANVPVTIAPPAATATAVGGAPSSATPAATSQGR